MGTDPAAEDSAGERAAAGEGARADDGAPAVGYVSWVTGEVYRPTPEPRSLHVPGMDTWLTVLLLVAVDIVILALIVLGLSLTRLGSTESCSAYWPDRARDALIGIALVLILAIGSVLLAQRRKWNVAAFVIVQLVLVLIFVPMQFRRYEHATQLARRISNGEPFTISDPNALVIDTGGKTGSCSVTSSMRAPAR